MSTRSAGVVYASCAFVLTMAAARSASADYNTWVSGVGDDVNPCTRTAPCRTFAGALPKTDTFGTIGVLDPGEFGGVLITKSVTTPRTAAVYDDCAQATPETASAMQSKEIARKRFWI